MSLMVTMTRTPAQLVRVSVSSYVVSRGTQRVLTLEWDPHGQLPREEVLRRSLGLVLAALYGADEAKD